LLEDNLADLQITYEDAKVLIELADDHQWLTHGWRNDLIFVLQGVIEIEANWDEVLEYFRYGALLPFDRIQRKMELDHFRCVSRQRASRRQQRVAEKRKRKALTKTSPRGGRHKIGSIDLTSIM